MGGGALSEEAGRRVLKEWLRIYGPAVLIAVAAFAIGWQFVQPAPPSRIVMATGPAGGAYAAFAERYRQELARDGIALDLRETRGSVENLALLQDPGSGVDVAFLQGGIVPAEGSPRVEALASVFLEPVWLFTRLDPPPDRITGLRGLRVAIGPQGSGTHDLMIRALALNGLGPANTSLLPLAGDEAAAALRDGKVDVVAQVASAQSPVVQALAREAGVRLVDARLADGYAQRFRALQAVTLHEGVLDFSRDLPPADTRLVAAIAALVVRDGFHPALVGLFLQAAQRVHGPGDLFSAPGTFPVAEHAELPVASGAKQYLEQGPGFLRRYLPFWVADLVQRSVFLVIPFLTLLLPFLRIVPPAIDWRIRQRAFRWYRELRAIEADAGTGDRAELRRRLDEVEARVRELRMPLSKSNLLYELRQHLDLVRRKLDALSEEERHGLGQRRRAL